MAEQLMVQCRKCQTFFGAPSIHGMSRSEFSLASIENVEYACPWCGMRGWFDKADHVFMNYQSAVALREHSAPRIADSGGCAPGH